MPSDSEILAQDVLPSVPNSLHVEDYLLACPDRGGRAILFGEQGDKFQTGRLRPARLAQETLEIVSRRLEALRARAGSLLVACDAEQAAVNRLQGLVGEFPTLVTAHALPNGQRYTILHDHARHARALLARRALGPQHVAPRSWLHKAGNDA